MSKKHYDKNKQPQHQQKESLDENKLGKVTGGIAIGGGCYRPQRPTDKFEHVDNGFIEKKPGFGNRKAR